MNTEEKRNRPPFASVLFELLCSDWGRGELEKDGYEWIEGGTFQQLRKEGIRAPNGSGVVLTLDDETQIEIRVTKRLPADLKLGGKNPNMIRTQTNSSWGFRKRKNKNGIEQSNNATSELSTAED